MDFKGLCKIHMLWMNFLAFETTFSQGTKMSLSSPSPKFATDISE
jgi:hypothetical protein